MKWLALLIIRIYKRRTENRPHVCRYVPSCSTYGYEAITRFGFADGIILFSERIKRCTSDVPKGTPDPTPTKEN